MSAEEKYFYPSFSTFSFPSGISETTISTITPTQNMLFKGAFLDLNNLTQNAIIRVKYETNNDGTYYTFETINFVASSNNKAILVGKKVPAQYDVRITIQSAIAEGVSRNIPKEEWYMNLGNVNA